MMDPLSITGSSLAVLVTLTKIISQAAKLYALRGRSYRYARFGWVGGHAVAGLRLVNSRALEEMHWNINTWTDQEVMDWKQSQLNICNAIAVAGAIFASIGLTALQLPNMYDVHWTARSLCASSMVLGILSVSTATSQYQAMAQLNNSLSVRLWLSRGRPTPYLIDLPEFILLKFSAKQADDQPQFKRYGGLPPFDRLPLESSLTILKKVSFPRHLLDLAVLLFLVGFGLYFLLLWQEKIENIMMASRNVFVIFVITVGVVLLYDITLDALKITNDDKKKKEFGLQNLRGDLNRAETIKQLEKELADCQRTLRFMRGLEEQPIVSQPRPNNDCGREDGTATQAPVAEKPQAV